MPIDPLLVFIDLMQRAGAADACRGDDVGDDVRDATRRERGGRQARRRRREEVARSGRWVPVPTIVACALGDNRAVYRAVASCELTGIIEVTPPGHFDDVLSEFAERLPHVGERLRIVRFDRFEVSP